MDQVVLFPPWTTRSLAGPHRKCLFRPSFAAGALFMIYSSPWTRPLLVPSYFALASLVVLILQAPSPRDQPNGFGFARPSALPSRTSRRALALASPASSPPVEATTAVKDHVEWSGASTIFFFQLARLVLSSRSLLPRYSASSGKKKSNSSSSRPPSIPPACSEWTHCAAAASTDAKSQSISTVMEVDRSRNASGSTSRFVSTTVHASCILAFR